MNNIINSNYWLNKARHEGYAVPAFNFHNLETVQVILDTAKAMESPLFWLAHQAPINTVVRESLSIW